MNVLVARQHLHADAGFGLSETFDLGRHCKRGQLSDVDVWVGVVSSAVISVMWTVVVGGTGWRLERYGTPPLREPIRAPRRQSSRSDQWVELFGGGSRRS